MRTFLTALLLSATALSAPAAVIMNEIFMNPPGSYDDTREYIELLGTPGMKLDGYGIALIYGAETKYYPLGSIPPRPVAQEIDEFFSLDGLQLGANGLLVIGIGAQARYPTLLSDTTFRQWTNIWNGGYDTPGKLENDGSKTVMLVRNRPGRTQADPTNPGGLRWGKDVLVDDELVTPAEDPQQPGVPVDQYGNGAIDKGLPNNFGGDTLDLRGALTLDDVSDDLEIVDEIGYEHERGWEYDVDSRGVDEGSTHGGLPSRNVHSLDDPQGFNPDVLTRVDYRTKGTGWTPAPGATGEMPNGNNWQDAATEQWIRGETIVGTGGAGLSPWFYFDVASNDNPDAIQPYVTNVPLWLDDGVGADFNFSAAETYQIMAGRVNPLAVPYIPGDTDRDGDCDQDDIDKLAAVFGDDDWIFSNSFAEAPEGKDGDPAAQTRPWDVDATGDNGIEASDLQWTLNFQGNTNGRIVGVRYDDVTPATTGVVLNPNTGVSVTLYSDFYVPNGHSINNLATGDAVEMTILAVVSGGANNTPGAENGVMQYVHDVVINTPGVLRVVGVEAMEAFNTTRADAQNFVGNDGDLGIQTVNGFTTDFTAGLHGLVPMYRVTLRAIGQGVALVQSVPATASKFQASAPHGVKVGHTAQNGDPASVSGPAAIVFNVTHTGIPGDVDGDGDVDLSDLAALLGAYGACLGSPAYNPNADFDGSGCIELGDLAELLGNYGRSI